MSNDNNPWLPPAQPQSSPYTAPAQTVIQPTPPKRKGHKVRNGLLIAGVAIVGLGAIGAATGSDEDADADAVATQEVTSDTTEATEAPDTTPVASEAPEVTEAPTVAPTTEAPVITTPPTEAPTTTEAPELPVSASDFAITMFITENECYDSAGALITAEPDLTYLGTQDLTGREFTIVFDVSGGGLEQTGSVELQSDGKYSYESEMYDVPTCPDTLTATVTAVRER